MQHAEGMSAAGALKEAEVTDEIKEMKTSTVLILH